MIVLETDRRVAVVGDVVRARASWQHGKAPKEVRVELRWYTEGRGTRNRGVVDRVVHTADAGPIPPVIEAVLTVPREGPVTYDGSMIRIRWEVHATVDVAWARDPDQSVPLVVRPGVAEDG